MQAVAVHVVEPSRPGNADIEHISLDKVGSIVRAHLHGFHHGLHLSIVGLIAVVPVQQAEIDLVQISPLGLAQLAQLEARFQGHCTYLASPIVKALGHSETPVMSRRHGIMQQATAVPPCTHLGGYVPWMNPQLCSTHDCLAL